MVPAIYLLDRFDGPLGILSAVASLTHTEELGGEDTIEFDCAAAPEKGGGPRGGGPPGGARRAPGVGGPPVRGGRGGGGLGNGRLHPPPRRVYEGAARRRICA